MALTATILAVYRGQGQADEKIVKVSGDTSYPTGGYAVTPSLFGFNAFEPDSQGTGLPPVIGYYSIVGDCMGTPNTWYSAINPVNGNLQLFVTTTGVEVASAVNVSTFAAVLDSYGH